MEDCRTKRREHYRDATEERPMVRTSRQHAQRLALAIVAVIGLGGGLVAVSGPSGADVTAVTGSACGYLTDVSLFGGPSMRRGCGQTDDVPAGTSPSVTLPAGGSATPITATDPDGATAQYGPAKIFSGQYPENDFNATSPPSGPLNVSTRGTLGPNGSVTSTASVDPGSQPPPGLPAQPRGIGPGPVIADAVSSTCTAQETDPGTGAVSVSGSTTVTAGILETKYDAMTQLPTVTEDVPANPPANYTRTGTIDHVGDSFRVVYNEQIVSPDGKSITVNAVHMTLLGPTAVGDMIIAQSVCGLTTVPVTTTAGPTTTSTTPGSTTSSVPGSTTTSTVPGSTTSTVPGSTTSSVPGSTTSTVPGSTTTSIVPGSTTTITLPTTSTLVGPGGDFCAQLRDARTRVNAQIDAFRLVVTQSFPAGAQRDAILLQLERARTQANTSVDQVLVTRCPTPTP
jgi:hypothetical protein